MKTNNNKTLVWIATILIGLAIIMIGIVIMMMLKMQRESYDINRTTSFSEGSVDSNNGRNIDIKTIEGNKHSDNKNNSQMILSKRNSSSDENEDSIIYKIDNTWNLYQNKKAGISFKLPQKAYDSISDTYRNVSVANTGNVYNIVFTDTREVLESIILNNNIMNDKELLEIVKNEFGQGCDIVGKKNSSQNGVYKAFIRRGAEIPDNGPTCANVAIVLYYDSIMEKAVMWNVGQECPLWKNADICYEGMLDSLKFLH